MSGDGKNVLPIWRPLILTFKWATRPFHKMKGRYDGYIGMRIIFTDTTWVIT